MNIEICKKCKYCSDHVVGIHVFGNKHKVRFYRRCFGIGDNDVLILNQIFEYPEIYDFCNSRKYLPIYYDFNMNQFPYIEDGVSVIENKMKNFIKNKLFFKKCPYYIEHQIDNWNGE